MTQEDPKNPLAMEKTETDNEAMDLAESTAERNFSDINKETTLREFERLRKDIRDLMAPGGVNLYQRTETSQE